MPEGSLAVIVTSAGTASAISVIKSLKAQSELPVTVIAVDADHLAAGLFLADAWELVPRATDLEYIPALIRIGQKYSASVLVPIYSKEIQIIAANKRLLEEGGLRTFVSDPESIELCNNKRMMCIRAKSLGICTPHVYDSGELDSKQVSFPLFAKPNIGSSSLGAEKVYSMDRVRELRASNPDVIFQPYIQGEEVTVDVLCDQHFNPVVVAPRLRLAVKAGQSVKARTIEAAPFIEPVTSLCRSIGIRGACNVQFFRDNTDLIFLEINPRFAAGGLMLTVAAGANIPLLLLKLVEGRQIRQSGCITQPGVSMTRYWEEIIVKP